LITAVKYSLLLLLAIELCKNSITLDIVFYKKVQLLFFQRLNRETLANFNNFWHATLGRNLMQMFIVLGFSP